MARRQTVPTALSGGIADGQEITKVEEHATATAQPGGGTRFQEWRNE
jgi:hypothetical protein